MVTSGEGSLAGAPGSMCCCDSDNGGWGGGDGVAEWFFVRYSG